MKDRYKKQVALLIRIMPSAGTPDWSKCSAGDLSAYPSVQWKLLNIDKLKKSNPKKFNDGIAKLCGHLRL